MYSACLRFWTRKHPQTICYTVDTTCRSIAQTVFVLSIAINQAELVCVSNNETQLHGFGLA